MYICNSMCACLCYLTTWCKALCRMAIHLKPFFGTARAAGHKRFRTHGHMWVAGLVVWMPPIFEASDPEGSAVMDKTKNAMSPEEQLEDLQRRFTLLEGERKAGGWRCWSVVFSVIHTSWLVSSLASFMTWFWP